MKHYSGFEAFLTIHNMNMFPGNPKGVILAYLYALAFVTPARIGTGKIDRQYRQWLLAERTMPATSNP
jgi:hypothetical protein